MPSASRRLELGRSKDPPSKTAHPICMEDTRILICFVRFAIIHLNKLTSLSLRDFPPLKPFERRDHSNDIYEDLAIVLIRRTLHLCLRKLP